MTALPLRLAVATIAISLLSLWSNARNLDNKAGFFGNTTQCLTDQLQAFFNAGSNLGNDLQSCTSDLQNLGQDAVYRINTFAQECNNLMALFQKMIGCGGFFCQWTDFLNMTSQATQIASDLSQLTADIFASPTQWSPIALQCLSDTIGRVSGTFNNVSMCFTNPPSTTSDSL